MKNQLKSVRKQQQVKSEHSKLSYKSFLTKSGGDKRKAFEELKDHIERRLPLCLTTWRHKTHKIGFLRDSLVSEDWSENTLLWVGASTSWRGLCTELVNVLQIRIEREGDSRDVLEPVISASSKPHISSPHQGNVSWIRVRRFLLELWKEWTTSRKMR